MKKFLAFALIVASLALGGCTQFKQAVNNVEAVYDTITSVRATPKAIVLAIQAFDVSKIGATAYISQPRCTDSNRPFCRDPGVMATLEIAVYEGTKARNELKAWVRKHPNGAGPQDVFDKLGSITATIKKLTGN